MLNPTGHHLRRFVLFMLAGALAVLAAAWVTSLVRLQRAHLLASARRALGNVVEFWPHEYRDQARLLEAYLGEIQSDPALAAAFRSGDRARLLAAARPRFRQMRRRSGVTHFYFIRPDGTCFLRVHKPDRNGDRIDRFTLRQAMETGAVAAGVELGPLGTLTLRVVAPWRTGTRLIGFVELGTEAQYLAEALHRALGVDLIFTVDKSLLRKADWAAGMRMLGHPADWDRFREAAMVGGTLAALPAALPDIESLPFLDGQAEPAIVEAGGRTVAAGLLPLQDARHREIGTLLVLKDVSFEVAQIRRHLVVFGAITAGVGTLLLAVFFVLGGRIEQRLRNAWLALQEENEARRRAEAELRRHRDRLEEMVARRTRDLEAANGQLRRAEADARDAHAELAQVFEATGNGIRVIGRDCRVVRVNRAFLRIAGGAAGDWVGRPCREHLPCPDCGARRCCLQEGPAAVRTGDFEMEVPRAGGERAYCVVATTPLHDAEGRLVGVVQSFHDITHRRRAEEEIRRAKEEWDRTFDAIGDVVTLHDPEMRLLRVNRAACDLFGATPEDLVGRHCHEIFRGAPEPCPGCPVAAALANHSPHAVEITHPNLGKVFLVTASPVMDPEGRLSQVVHIARDVTRIKKMEAELRQAQKMEAVGILSGGVAHDFNNILTGIGGYTDLCLAAQAADSPLRHHLEQILALVRRGADLTRQLLAFSRKQPLDRRPLDLNRVVSDVARMLARVLGDDVRLEVTTAPGLSPVMGDRAQLEQVLVNMAVNARDAMPEGGTLTIATGARRIAPGDDVPRKLPPGDYVELVVRDTGVGMDEAVLEQIFEPFFTTKDVGKGTGLGLATAYGIVEQHGGTITVESAPGRGTTFRVYLPAGGDVPGAEEAAAGPGAEPPRGSGTILLVEDEPAIRQMFVSALQGFGYTVLPAADPDEAEDLLRRHRDAVDLLVTDIKMPGRNGIELHRALGRERPGLKVIFMSGYADAALLDEAFPADARPPFLPKP
ncbi:PAS domain-containing protein, partial [Dissulfurirhabdus thermomarina]